MVSTSARAQPQAQTPDNVVWAIALRVAAGVMLLAIGAIGSSVIDHETRISRNEYILEGPVPEKLNEIKSLLIRMESRLDSLEKKVK